MTNRFLMMAVGHVVAMRGYNQKHNTLRHVDADHVAVRPGGVPFAGGGVIEIATTGKPCTSCQSLHTAANAAASASSRVASMPATFARPAATMYTLCSLRKRATWSSLMPV